jgi:hypothetical protein
MGEQGQIKIGGVYLYTHWCGDTLKETLKAALSKRWRWQDESYLARIIFCEMMKGDEEGETGFGITTYKVSDLDWPLLIVDIKNQKVIEETDEGNKTWSFEDFIK